MTRSQLLGMGRISLKRRKCAQCERTTHVALRGWRGRWLVTSHGLCRRCVRRLVPALERKRPAHSLARG